MKQLFKLFVGLTGRWGLVRFIGLGLLSGFCSFLFINSVTRVIGLIIGGQLTIVSKEYLLLFATIILLFVWVRKTLALGIIRVSQTLFWRLRKDILKLVLRSNYRQLVAEKNEVYSAIVSDVNVLTNVSMTLIDFCTAIILSVSCLVYLCTISVLLFLITLGVALTGVTIYHFRSASNVNAFKEARALETRFQASFNSILNGFKEITMDPRKGRAIFDKKIDSISRKAYSNNSTAFAGFLENQITGQILFYLLISSVLLLFSITLRIKTSDTISFIFTLLYLLGSIETIMLLLPGLARAKIASKHLMSLKKRLEGLHFQSALPASYIQKEEFEHLEVHGLYFKYSGDKDGFGIGPITFEVQRSEIVFIYGGNGSGKTTFIHAILGLSVPSGGEIRINGQMVAEDNYSTYRTAFAVVFSDFYLFDELVGVDNYNQAKWEFYLQLFELSGKVSLNEGVFSSTDLSAGQRKRLALIAALLENKPVLVIDEWAADQDPHFRKKFYTEILPLLKEDGLTIIAITHDDKYYHCADKLYKMEYGKLSPEWVQVPETQTI